MASCRQHEEIGSSQNSISVVDERKTVSPCLSDSLTLSLASADKEAAWVVNNRAKLIQNVTCVMQIADEMIQQNMIHKELYEKIKAAGTPMDKMRELYSGLTSSTSKVAFYRILHETEPAMCQGQHVLEEIMKKHKDHLNDRFEYEYEGTEKNAKAAKLLERIYTELHIIEGESKGVNTDHEIWEIQDKTRSETDDGTKINCNDIFKCPLDQGTCGGTVRTIRTVMTKGIAGIGKTVSVKKFILDWANGRANQDLDFIVVLPFRELNLVTDDPFSLETLVKEFHPELRSIAVAKTFANHKVMFIFDGLDESQLQLNFKTTKMLTDATKEASVDTVVTNVIRECLLPSALVWITSRPGAVKRIPRKYVHQWTEVRGFNETQKITYFRKRIEDEAVAERVINHILTSRSLFIMCHIPIFCWITAKVLQHLLPKMDQQEQTPTTLTEMYTHFLSIQMQVADKYSSESEPDTEEMFSANEEFIFKLGRLAFEQLEKGKIIFTARDLSGYGIDINKAAVCSGLCTEILKEENVFNNKKLYCFVHLTVQEYFAALFVYRSFACKKIDSPALKDFMLKGSEEELKSVLDADPVDETLDVLVEIVLANSTQRTSGELDMFLRFLVGLSLESTQELLQGLIEQTDDHSAVVENIKTSLLELDLLDCSPERCLNLVHCLFELKDSSLHDTVRQHLTPGHWQESLLSPVQCSALADTILMSNEPLDEFNLMQYRTSVKGSFRLIPALRNCRKATLSGQMMFDSWICEAVSSALRMPNKVLTELHLLNTSFYDKGTRILIDGLNKCQCKLEALSLSGTGLSESVCENLASAVNGITPNLRELELSGDILNMSLCSVLSVGLRQPKLQTLRLNRNPEIGRICEELSAAFTSGLCYLRELDLSYSLLRDSELVGLSTGLLSKSCVLQSLSLSHNRVTEKGCVTLASVLSSETSHLTELDLSYNDLYDVGVMKLCEPLKKPQCGLKSLKLSFCKVTGEACAPLASALRSDGCKLKQLVLSFNHLTDRGVELLMEIQKDSSCSLETLNTEKNEDCWFDLKLLRKYACDLTLDSNTAGVKVILSKDNKMATHAEEKQPYPDHPDRFECAQVLCKEGLSGGCHYWEAECMSTDVGVAYKSMLRKGDSTHDYNLGHNEKSWCWNYKGQFKHNGSSVDLLNCPYSCTIGVYLDWAAGVLSFFDVFRDKVTLLYTVRTTFTEPLHPGFYLNDGSVYLCEMK